MRSSSLPVWKQAPFIRLLIPFCSGILLQYYANPALVWAAMLMAISFVLYLVIFYAPISIRYILGGCQGILISLITGSVAMMLTWKADISHHPQWFGRYLKPGDSLLIRIDEELQEKPRSFKTTATVLFLIRSKTQLATAGKLTLYFSKEPGTEKLSYGDIVCISRDPSLIRNAGNPGGFDYARYSAMQGIYHTVYLKKNQWNTTGARQANLLQQTINRLRNGVLSVMQESFADNKPVQGIAEALLIGYKDHLDRDLVQEYTQAGVVHIIAISGLHLGLIYWMITRLLAIIPFTKKRPWLQHLLSFLSLWTFALITGASASVLRSAVMFSCMLLGKMLLKKSSVLQSLTASAFLLLAWNPYLLWDVGFQLSYLALSGIILLQKQIQRLIYFKQPWLQKTWEMFAVTLAAQIGTFPVCLFYFHQFPTYFFIANMIAVPFSTMILFLEIGLLVFSWIGPLNMLLTLVCAKSITWMNDFIHWVNNIPGSVISGIYADLPTTIALHAVVIGFSGWLILRNKRWLLTGLICLIFFVFFHALSDIKASRQEAIILYNVSGRTAVDFISGRKCMFWGDDSLATVEYLKNFHLKPTRTLLQVSETKDSLAGLQQASHVFRFKGRTLFILDSSYRSRPGGSRIPIDIILISGNPRIRMKNLSDRFKPSIIIFDPSNSLWKIAQWKKDCEALHLPCFSIPERGARVILSGEPLTASFPDR